LKSSFFNLEELLNNLESTRTLVREKAG
jgi:hypothetical protein